MISYKSRYTSTYYYTLEHPEIELTSSSKQKVEQFETELENVTLEDIKQNRITERYHLLLDLSLAGSNELIYDLLKLKQKRDSLASSLLEQRYKKVDQDCLKKGRCYREATEIVEKSSGWVL